jgi:hypothetical protein
MLPHRECCTGWFNSKIDARICHAKKDHEQGKSELKPFEYVLKVLTLIKTFPSLSNILIVEYQANMLIYDDNY